MTSSRLLISIKLGAVLASLMAASAQAAEPAPAPTTLTQSADFIGTALNVVDLDRAVKFYTEALGLKVVTKLQFGTRSETILHFQGAGSQPSLLLMHDTGPNAPKALDQGAAFSRLVIRTVDIAALEARMTQLGYAHDPIRNGSMGTRVMMMRDPEGFRLEIVQVSAQRSGQ